MTTPPSASGKPRWIAYVLIAALVSFVLLDLLIVVSGTRVLAQALQPVAPASSAGDGGQWMCRYFDGTGFVMVPVSAEPGRVPECPLLLPAAGSH